MIDVDEEDDCYYLVMEYIEGPTLSEYIESHGPLSVDTAIHFTNQILMVLNMRMICVLYIEILSRKIY